MECVLRSRFGVIQGGVLLDVGAYHPTILSNSAYFEFCKGFKAILVEANPIMAELLRSQRHHVYEFAASGESDKEVDFQIVHAGHDSFGYGGSGMHTYEGVRSQTTARTAYSIKDIKVKTITLDDVLSREGVTGLDILMMDIEGHEMNALSGLDLKRWKPKVCCIENYFSDPVMDVYMQSNSYVKFTRVERDDLFFLWEQ